MTTRVPAPLAVALAAAVVIPLAFDPASVRPFVGPKLVLALGLGAVALAAVAATPVGPLRWRGLSSPARAVVVAAALHAAALAIATAFSLVPAASLAGDLYRGMGLVTRAALLAVAVAAALGVAGRPERVRLLLRAILATTTVVALYAVVQALRLDPLVDPALLEQTSRAGVTELRVVSTLGHANFVGHLLLFGTGAAVALVGSEPARSARALSLAAGLLAVLGLLVSGARGAWVGLAAQGLLLLASTWRAALTRRRLTAAALCGLALVAAALATGPLAGPVATRAEAFRSDNLTGSGRTLLWRDALPMVGRYWLHGCGPETFQLAFLPYRSAELTRAEPYALYDRAHDLLLDSAIETGLVGALALVALLASLGWLLSDRIRRGPPGGRAVALGLALGLLGYAVHGLFLFDTIAVALYLYLFAALAVGSSVAPEEEVGRRPAWRKAVAFALLVTTGVVVLPRLRLLWRADREMATAERLSAEGRLPEAIANGRASVANGEVLGPAPELRHRLARLYARVGDAAVAPEGEERRLVEEGRAEVERAFVASTTPQLLHVEAAGFARRLALVDEEIARLRAALTLDPMLWYARARLSQQLLARGDREEARHEAALALDLNPESREARGVLEALR